MITDNQQRVLDYIRDEQARTGVSPSLRELQLQFGYASKTSITAVLQALEKKGVLNRNAGKARALTLAHSPSRNMRQVPIYGTIPAGLPADQTQESDGFLAIDTKALAISPTTQVFALKVRGDSMVNAGILNNDYAFIALKEATDGNIVAALIDGESTLKRFLLRRGRPYLKAENDAYPDLIPARELVIQGVYCGLLRAA